MKFVIVSSLCGFLVVMLSYAKLREASAYREKSNIINAAIYSVALLVWPLVWYKALGTQVINNRFSSVSLLWPIIILGFDIAMLKNSSDDVHSKKGVLNIDSNTICGLTFALSGILGSQFPTKKLCCSKLFMYAIIGCLVFILPFSHTSSSSMEVVTLECIQRVFLTFSTSFLIAGTLYMNSEVHESTP